MSTKAKPNYIVRNLELSDCEEIRQLWTEAKFIISKYNNEYMMATDPNGVYVAQDVDSGKLIGVCNGFNVSPTQGKIGSYLVKPEYQGLGIGPVLWRKCLEHIGDRNIAIYSSPDMWTKYRDRNDFKVVAEKRLLQFIGKPNLDKLIDSIDGISLQSINEDNIKSVVKYDKRVGNGLDREVMIREMIKIKDSVNLVAINEKQEILGYCVLFPTNLNTGVFEPLYADNEKIAELLVRKSCQLFPITTDKGLKYFCWNNNQKSMAIANKIGLTVNMEMPILFSKTPFEGNTNLIYCVSSRSHYTF